MDGLAANMAGPSAQGQLPTVEEIAQLLMQGVDPRELLQAGIPEQLIMEAIALLEQQMGSGQAPMGPDGGAIPPQDMGLAQSLQAR